MPCLDGGGAPSIYELQNRITKLENRETQTTNAILCGILTAAERLGFYQDLINNFDEATSGVRRDMVAVWWSRHKIVDQIK